MPRPACVLVLPQNMANVYSAEQPFLRNDPNDDSAEQPADETSPRGSDAQLALNRGRTRGDFNVPNGPNSYEVQHRMLLTYVQAYTAYRLRDLNLRNLFDRYEVQLREIVTHVGAYIAYRWLDQLVIAPVEWQGRGAVHVHLPLWPPISAGQSAAASAVSDVSAVQPDAQ